MIGRAFFTNRSRGAIDRGEMVLFVYCKAEFEMLVYSGYIQIVTEKSIVF